MVHSATYTTSPVGRGAVVDEHSESYNCGEGLIKKFCGALTRTLA